MNSEKIQKILHDSIHYFNTHGIPNYTRVKKIIDPTYIINKERRRLGVTNPNLTLQQLGLETVTKPQNLYNKMSKHEIRITSVCANSLSKVKLTVRSNSQQTVELEAGTLLFPDQQVSDSMQTLIIRDDLSTTVSEGESELDIETFCFNQELKAPRQVMFSLGNIKSTNFEKGMSQSEVWDITRRQREMLHQLERGESKMVNTQ